MKRKPGSLTKREVIVLEQLATGPKYGLDLIAGSDGQLTRSTLYVHLARMENDELIEWKWKLAEPIDTLLHQRRIYSATELGLSLLLVQVSASPKIMAPHHWSPDPPETVDVAAFYAARAEDSVSASAREFYVSLIDADGAELHYPGYVRQLVTKINDEWRCGSARFSLEGPPDRLEFPRCEVDAGFATHFGLSSSERGAPAFMLDLSPAICVRGPGITPQIVLSGVVFELMSRVRATTSVPASRSETLGPVVRVDVYECEADRLRVEVERVPGADDASTSAFMEAERGDPTCPCPECEREMTRVGTKLRKTVTR